ncbi:MAG: right-handed parallel beta-helix repeat-containing protein, partial [Patescibacteria group bacterium]
TSSNGTATAPGPGSIRGLWFKPTSGGSELDNVMVRYGGRYYNNNAQLSRAILGIEEAGISVRNSTFEHSYSYGVRLEDSDSIFEGNVMAGSAFEGMLVEGGSPEIRGNIFKLNRTGILVTNAPAAEIADNFFEGNAGYAINNSGEIARYSGNSGEANGIGGIGVTHDFLPDGVTTLKKNDIPYILDRQVLVTSGKALTFEPGVVFKGRYGEFPQGVLTIKDGGRVFYNGATSSEIIFTSFYDDSIGGDSDNSTTTPKAGDWTGIEVAVGGELDMSGFTIRYAGEGRREFRETRAGLRITGGSATTTNALISTNKEFGVRVLGGGSLYMKDSHISDHVEEGGLAGVGLGVFDSTAVIENIDFSNNEINIKTEGAYSLTCTGTCSD